MAARLVALVRRTRRWDALLLTAGIWFVAKFLRYAFPPLFETFQSEFDVSTAVLGSVFSAMMLAYAAMQFPSGALADRVGAVRVMAVGAVLAAVGALLVFGAGGFAALVAAMLLVGVGTGAHKTVAVALLPTVYTRSPGRALGALDTFGTFGGVAAPAVVVALAGSPVVDWPALFLAAGAAGLVLAGAVAVRVPRRVPDAPDDGASGGSEGPPATDADETATDGGAGLRRYVVLFAEPGFRTFVGVTLLVAFAYYGVAAFLPLYLTDAVGLDPATASLAYSGLFLVSVVQPVTGEASDQVGRLPVIAATIALAGVGLFGLLVAQSAVVAVGAVVVFGVGGHGFRPVRGAHLFALVPDAVAGGSLGVVRTGFMGTGAVAPAVVGVVAEWAGFRAAFGLLGVSLVGALVLVGVLYRQ